MNLMSYLQIKTQVWAWEWLMPHGPGQTYFSWSKGKFINTAGWIDSVCFTRLQTIFQHFLAPEEIKAGNMLKTNQCKMMIMTCLFCSCWCSLSVLLSSLAFIFRVIIFRSSAKCKYFCSIEKCMRRSAQPFSTITLNPWIQRHWQQSIWSRWEELLCSFWPK